MSGTPREWHDYAMSVPVPAAHEIGHLGVRLVLLHLLTFVNADTGMAWPGAETIATDCPDLNRRKVRAALSALADAGLIVPAGMVGRSRQWFIPGIYAYADDHDAGRISRRVRPESVGSQVSRLRVSA